MRPFFDLDFAERRGGIMSVVRQLYQLQQLDSEWDERSNRLAEVNESLGETDDLIRAREALAEIDKQLGGLQTRLRALELDIAGVNDKLKKNQNRLYGGKVRNPKELSNLQDEAAALNRRLAELEDDQLELLIEIEETEAELAERGARLRQIEATWHDDQGRLQAEKEELELRLLELEEERAAKRSRIGAGELAEYDDLRDRFGGTAVTELKRGTCQACGVGVPTGMAREVERGEGIYYCPVCSRLLFGG
jgi:predicted  nucleic acid-binding Zn-ribbon protein